MSITEDLNYIKIQLAEMPQLLHASNIKGKYEKKLSSKERNALHALIPEYAKYLRGMIALTGIQDGRMAQETVYEAVALLNEYYDFMHGNGFDNALISQGKFRPTILEEFLFLIFRSFTECKAREFNAVGILSSGSVKAYTNLYLKASDFKEFILNPEAGVNEKDQDFAIFRHIDLSVGGKECRLEVPALAIEAKTYIDKTMLDSIIATAEKIKSGNPHAFFVAVAERYDVSFKDDPSYSRIDQIYILRKRMRKNEWLPICPDVVWRLYNDGIRHLERPWVDIEKRVSEDGVVL